MSELLTPSSDSSRNQYLNFTREFGTPLDVYKGYFSDGDIEIRVIVDTTDHSHVEEGELYSELTHEVSVFEISGDTKRKIAPPDANRYPFTARVERSAFKLSLMERFPDESTVILQGPNHNKDGASG